MNEKFLLTGFLDSVDPEMLVIDLGDEPPLRIATDTPKTPVDVSHDNTAKPNSANHADTQLTQNENRKGPADGTADQLKSNPVPYQVMKPDSSDAGSTLRAVVENNWKWFAGTAGVLLLGGAGWRGRAKWIKAARRLRSR